MGNHIADMGMLMTDAENIRIEMIFMSVADENIYFLFHGQAGQSTFGVVEDQHMRIRFDGKAAVPGTVDYNHGRHFPWLD